MVGALDVKFDVNGNVTSCSGTPQVLVGDTYKVGSVAASDADATAYRSQLNASGVFRITTPSAADGGTGQGFRQTGARGRGRTGIG